MAFNLRRVFGSGLLLFSLGMLVWSAWPYARQSSVVEFPASDLQAVIDNLEISNGLLGTPAYLLTISWPERNRAGEIGEITLDFTPQENPGATQQEGTNQAVGKGQDGAQIESPYLALEARMEASYLKLMPTGNISQKLVLGQPVTFVWHIQPEEAQGYRGVVWVYLRSVPGSTEAGKRQVLTAQEVSIQSLRFLGLSSLATRLLGSIGAAIGAVLAFDKASLDLLAAMQRRLFAK